MAKEITLPKLSEDADEGEVAEIMIKEGDTIEKDDSIIAVSSDKATVEVPSPEAGTVKEIKVSEGDTIKTGDVIAVLEEESEDEETEETEEDEEGDEQEEEQKEESEADEGDESEEEEEPDEEEETREKEESEQEEKSEKQDVEEDEAEEEDREERAEEEEQEEKETTEGGEKETQKEDTGEGKEPEEPAEEESTESEEMHAAPGAKRLARKHDVNLEEIEGSGPDGLITEDDVKKAAGVDTRKAAAGQGLELPDFSQWGPVERKELSSIRKATARQTQSSWQTIPHVTQFDEADVSGIEKYIAEHRDKAEEQGGKLTITAVLTKIIANALHQYPKFNASIDMDKEEVILKKYIHIGIAVDTDEGLLVPVVRNVDEKSIIELAVEIPGIAEKARNGELGSEDMEGGSFIISNLGGIGGTQFTPVVYHPQVAILGASEMETKPVYNEETDSFRPQLTLPLSLSYDHRLIDGAEGARFLRYVCDALEDPYKALLGE